MDSRGNPPALYSFELITAENIEQQFSSMETFLRLPPDKLKTLFGGDHLSAFNHDLDYIFDDSMRVASKSIENATLTHNDEDPLTTRYFEQQRKNLDTHMEHLANHLESRQQVLMQEQAAAIADVQQQLCNPKDCYRGNYALKLDISKKNIAIALQHAAYYLHQQWPDLREQPDGFNTVFKDIAHIDEHGRVTLSTQTPDNYASLTLDALQNTLYATLSLGRQHKNPMVIRYIRDHLDRLSHERSAGLKNGETLFIVDVNSFAFTAKAIEIESLANTAAQRAKDLLNHLEASAESKVDALENDSTKAERYQSIRHTIKYANRDLQLYRQTIHHKERLANLVMEDKKEISALLAQAHAINNRVIPDSRLSSAERLKDLDFTAELRTKIINGLQEVLQNYHGNFLQHTKLDFMLQHYSMLAQQLDSLNTELEELASHALIDVATIQYPNPRLQGLEARRNYLRETLIHFREILEKIDAEYANVAVQFEQSRSEFIKFLSDTQKNYWREDLEQRLDATLLFIDDSIKKYAKHSAFRHTSLDDAITEHLRDLRESTLATKATLTPEFVPPSLRPAEHPPLNVLQRNPFAKNILVGAVIVAGAIALGTLAFGLVLSVASLNFVMAAVIGLSMAALIFGGASLLHKIERAGEMPQPPAALTRPVTSSTASIHKGINSSRLVLANDRAAVEASYDESFYDSSGEKEEVIRGYSPSTARVTFADDLVEYAPSHPRRP